VPSDSAAREKMAASDYAAERGARIFALSYPGPLRGRVSFATAGFDFFPGWSETMALPPDRLRAALSDPSERARLRRGAESFNLGGLGLNRFESYTVADGYTDRTRALEGRRLGDIAAERDQDVFDVLFDLAVEDLRTGFGRPPLGTDPDAWELRVSTWSDPNVIMGASDAGAHVDRLTSFDYTATLLSLARDRGALGLPAVVRLLTSVPAALYGFKELGRIADGFRADLVLFDPDTVAPGEVRWRDDMPGGAGRLFAEPVGIERVIVNGVEILTNGQLTGERPGRILRNGIDTGPNF
jgi:N-acyl-D-aspartate/D-glutamate deacylase